MPRKRKRQSKIRRIIRIPREYLEAIPFGKALFPPLFQFENGLRIAINEFLTTCYGDNWWEMSLKTKLPEIHKYAEEQETKRHSMPWIGGSARIPVLRIHLVTLGQLEEIVKRYESDCIPQLFPTMNFFLGHMEVIKKIRNLFSHMFPCITSADCQTARREIRTLSSHINTKLP